MRGVGARRVTLERVASQREVLDHEPLTGFTTQADVHALRPDPRDDCVDHRVQRRSNRDTPNGKLSRRSGGWPAETMWHAPLPSLDSRERWQQVG